MYLSSLESDKSNFYLKYGLKESDLDPILSIKDEYDSLSDDDKLWFNDFTLYDYRRIVTIIVESKARKEKIKSSKIWNYLIEVGNDIERKLPQIKGHYIRRAWSDIKSEYSDEKLEKLYYESG